jgi:hypothetical protein
VALQYEGMENDEGMQYDFFQTHVLYAEKGRLNKILSP